MTDAEEPDPKDAAIDPAGYRALRRIAEDDRHRLVVSFGGGGVPGLCGNLALARLLEQLDLAARVQQIWGTSAGAIVGGGWSTGTAALDILALVRSLDRRGAKDIQLARLLLALPLLPFRHALPEALMSGRQFRETIAAGLRVETFEECAIPFRCIACAYDTEARTKVFRRGKLLPAIVASMSLPGFLPPSRELDAGDPTGEPTEGATPTVYFDGGLVEKTPLLSVIAEHRRTSDRRRLVIIGTRFPGQDHAGPGSRGFIGRFLQGISAMQSRLWEYQLQEARSQPDVTLILLNPDLRDCGLFDFSCVDRTYAHARSRCLDLLQDARLSLTFGIR